MEINVAASALRTAAWSCGLLLGVGILTAASLQTDSPGKLKGLSAAQKLTDQDGFLHAPELRGATNRLIGSTGPTQVSSPGKSDLIGPNQKFIHQAGLLDRPESRAGTIGGINATKPIMTSQRWSGFSATSAQLGAPIYAMNGGRFTVPQVQYISYPGTPGTEEVSIWMGVGGNPDSDKTLVQVGVSGAINSSGATTYGGWYELLPATLQLISGCLTAASTGISPPQPVPCTVAPGDLMQVGMNCTNQCAEPQTWYLTMENVTEQWAWFTYQPYEFSLGSAEVVVEAPQQAGVPFPLAGYGAVSFLPNVGTSAALNANGLIAWSLANNGVVLNDPAGGTSTPCEPELVNNVAMFLPIVYGPSCLPGSFPNETDSHDFNGDGYGDILFRNPLGVAAMWLMNGGTVSQSAALGTLSSNFSIIGQHDFDGDGKADLLWRDSSGNISIWLMNGTTVASAAAVSTLTSNWTLYGTGDLNGDGKGDLLWRDSNTGTVAAWFMNGAAVASAASFGAVGSNWTIVGDGNGFILWRDTAGDIALWTMQNGKVSAANGLGNVTSNFVVQGVGDFNGDGNVDILWRDTNSGALAIWFTFGGPVTSAASVGTLPSNWNVAAVGDYNGDGQSDILLIDGAGDLAVWLMNGSTVSSSLGIANVGSTWTVQSLNAN